MKATRPIKLVCLLLLVGNCVAVPHAWAEVKLPAFFSDHMVLQRDASVPIWGTASPGEQVAVRLGRQKKTAKAGPDGKWMVRLTGLKAGGPLEMTVAGKNTITIKDVLVGEVWLASGQSNMDFTVAKTEKKYFAGVINEAAEIAAANYPQIRMFTVELKMADEPQPDVVGRWEVCSPRTVGDFSAVAYFFARDLHKHMNVPFGIITSAYGASTAQSWISKAALEADPRFKKILDDYAAKVTKFDPVAAEEIDKKAMAEFEAAVAKARADGTTPPRRPKLAPNPHRDQHNPFLMWNGQIRPLEPYAVRGALWYQGESVVGGNDLYLPLMQTLISSWRKEWGQGDFPFLFVQLAAYKAPATQPAPGGPFVPVREAQLKTLSVPNTAMAVTIDIGDENDVHPHNKQDVGLRLALAARATMYGEKIPYSGPIYDSMSVEGSAVRLRFKHTDGGLVAKGDKLTGFAIAGEDKKFVWADAKIDGDAVVVSSPEVGKRAAVRYGWADNPAVNLYNKAGLPASPFRTDIW